jgi:cytochrome c-type biogenesis protein
MSREHGFSDFLLVLLGLAVVSGLGYLGFRFFITTVMPSLPAFGLTFLAVVAAIATFFSPCSFPVLPSYIAFNLKTGKKANSLGLGLAAAAGVITFAVLLGTGIGILGEGFAKSFSISSPAPSNTVLFFRGLVGALLAGLGLASLTGHGFHSVLVDKLVARLGVGKKARYRAMFLYGFGYTAVGIGCAGPILAGLALFAFSTGGFLSALYAFLVYASAMGALMLLVSLLVGFKRESLLMQLKARTGLIKNATSLLLVLVGAFLILSSVYRELFVKLLFP